jgi:hypothetical protein
MLLNASLLNTSVLNGDSSSSGGSDDGDSGGSSGAFTRFVSAASKARMLDGIEYAVYVRVRIAGPDGVLLDYSNRNNIDWQAAVEVQKTQDEPIATASVKFIREQGSKSLSPFRTASNYNQIPYVLGDFSQGLGPSLDSGRRILIDFADVDTGTDPRSIEDADWHLVFEGTIDSVDAAKEQVVIDARDKSAELQDTWFPVPNVVNAASLSLPTVNIQQALAALLDLAHLTTITRLTVPVAPDPEVLVGSFRYDIEPVLDALLRVSQINGWDLRQFFSDATQQYELTYKDPGRNRTDVDWVLKPHSYIDITKWRIDRSAVRNDITVNYGPDDARLSYNTYSPESVARYGRRSMVLNEASDSPIQTEDAARLMAELILYDLAAPPLEIDAESFAFWPVEINNIVRFPANLVHSDTTVSIAVVGFKHTIEADGKSRTQWQFRGKPGLSYWSWFLRKPIIGGTSGAPDGDSPVPSGFGTLSQLPDYAADTIQFDWVYTGDGTPTFDLYVQRGNTGFVLEATGLSSPTHVYDVVTDIEPFHTPPDPPQIPIYVSYFVQAIVSGSVVATSPTSSAAYGFGP